MDSFGVDHVKAEKAKALRRYYRLQKIGTFLRVLEVCAALVVLSWYSTQFSAVIRISGHYLRELCIFLNNPRFVFLLGNAIIVTVFARSRQYSFHGSTAEADFCNDSAGIEPREKSVSAVNPPASEAAHSPEEYPAPETVQDKQNVCCDNAASPIARGTLVTALRCEAPETKRCRRTQSECFEREIYEVPRQELRRSETVMCRKSKSSEYNPAKCSVEELSSEEFRLTVEAFIQKNRSLMREESVIPKPDMTAAEQ